MVITAVTSTIDAPAQGRRLLRAVWRSPPGQPSWARPALLLIAAAAALVYAWGLSRNPLHPYYSAAVRSMSDSWQSFAFGALDPAASITLDKLPGALMVQALSARVFGFHTWSVLLPQVVATVVTILVLYRAVRRWQGPRAAILGAAAYATMPVVAVLARSQISDTLLVMLLVLAADAWTRAVAEGRLRSLLLSGLFVGLAFQAKMAQAWAVLPALAVAYLVAAPVPVRRRLGHLGLAGLTTAAVSLLYVSAVTLVPAAHRPYADGSPDNSLFYTVFQYNFLSRYAVGAQAGPDLGGAPFMFSDGVAPQVGWLYPVALAGLVAGLAWRGRAPRTDLARAGYLMWGLWLLIHAVAFSAGRVAHEFYVIAAAPAIAALAGGGAVTLWAAWRRGGPRRWALPATIVLTLGWTLHLSLRFRTFLPWLAWSAVVLGALCAAGLVAAPALRARYRRLGSAVGMRRSVRLAALSAALGVVACLSTPAGWAGSTVDSAYRGGGAGPAAGPRTEAGMGGPPGFAAQIPGAGQPGGPPQAGAGSSTSVSGTPAGGGGFSLDATDRPSRQTTALLEYLRSRQPGRTYLFAAPGLQALPYLVAGASVLPLGGFSGRVPFPTVDRLQRLVATGELRYVLIGASGFGVFNRYAAANRGGAPGIGAALAAWVTAHCTGIDAAGTRLYDCGAR
ncbi:glycosyltransferase family 39 protein [Catellatospora sp. KI3]|uniref:ArnT family glycosyltransferase n=1 Tax=Catellatospora sp. KI3 TaxID=3041620 RepID=UPI002482EA49|nr:glycosyltransferase family 39 protein [Catellatospora sp. KI3]MDI1460876.1 glycosyltransferase family 39 protein [Catellatospora sp. KI3]